MPPRLHSEVVKVTEVVTIRYMECRLSVYVPFLADWPIPKLKKLFRLLRDGLKQGWYVDTNENARDTIEAWLTEEAERTKVNWGIASDIYRNEYVDADFRFTKNSPLWKDAKRKNKRLLADVKKTKREYERAEKLLRYFRETMN